MLQDEDTMSSLLFTAVCMLLGGALASPIAIQRQHQRHRDPADHPPSVPELAQTHGARQSARSDSQTPQVGSVSTSPSVHHALDLRKAVAMDASVRGSIH